MQKCKEIFINCDIESDGPVPGINSMLSLGAAAIGWDTEAHKWQMSHTFSANLEPLPECSPDPKTMEEFWKKNPDAWAAVIVNREKPKDAMIRFRSWLASVHTTWNRRPVAVGAPATFDYPFIHFYMLKFLGTDYPFGHSCICMKSVASTLLKIPYFESGKRNYPKKWSSDKFKHTHIAVEDAIEQGWQWTHIVDAQ